MTVKQSKSIGGAQLLKSSAFQFLIFELIIFYLQTNGDFGNGIVFFIVKQLNFPFIFFIIFYFTCMFFFGKRAGFDILIRGRKYYVVALLNSLLTILLLSTVFILLFIIIYGKPSEVTKEHMYYLLIPRIMIFITSMTVTWFWATKKIEYYPRRE